MRGLLVILLLAAGLPARATGVSWAEVHIIPIAVSAKGVVLFKTWIELNPTGARDLFPATVGWLVVSDKGLWREVPHAFVDPVTDAARAEYERLSDEFRAAFDWKKPPASVRPLLAEFGIVEKDRVAPDLGKGLATWTPEKLCLRTKCVEVPITQWAPSGIRSESGRGNPIGCAFYAAGVALFRCDATSETFGSPKQPGAVFALPPNRYWDEREGLVDIGYDAQEIDAISVLPRSLRSQ